MFASLRLVLKLLDTNCQEFAGVVNSEYSLDRKSQFSEFYKLKQQQRCAIELPFILNLELRGNQYHL